MSQSSKSAKKSVELQPAAKPSRIRREPAPVDNAITRKLDRIDWGSREWEIRLAFAGILFVALALIAVVIDVGEVMSH